MKRKFNVQCSYNFDFSRRIQRGIKMNENKNELWQITAICSALPLNVPIIIFNGFCFSWYRHHYLINDHLCTSLQLKLYRLSFCFNFSSLSPPPFLSLSLHSWGPSIMCRLVLVLNIKQIDANQAQRDSLWIWMLKARMK